MIRKHIHIPYMGLYVDYSIFLYMMFLDYHEETDGCYNVVMLCMMARLYLGISNVPRETYPSSLLLDATQSQKKISPELQFLVENYLSDQTTPSLAATQCAGSALALLSALVWKMRSFSKNESTNWI